MQLEQELSSSHPVDLTVEKTLEQPLKQVSEEQKLYINSLLAQLQPKIAPWELQKIVSLLEDPQTQQTMVEVFHLSLDMAIFNAVKFYTLNNQLYVDNQQKEQQHQQMLDQINQRHAQLLQQPDTLQKYGISTIGVDQFREMLSKARTAIWEPPIDITNQLEDLVLNDTKKRDTKETLYSGCEGGNRVFAVSVDDTEVQNMHRKLKTKYNKMTYGCLKDCKNHQERTLEKQKRAIKDLEQAEGTILVCLRELTAFKPVIEEMTKELERKEEIKELIDQNKQKKEDLEEQNRKFGLLLKLQCADPQKLLTYKKRKRNDGEADKGYAESDSDDDDWLEK